MNRVIKAAVQVPSRIETGGDGVLNKNTGFPEPLSPYSNTTLTHPSADTSPNAFIESTDDNANANNSSDVVPTSASSSSRGSHGRNSSFQIHRPRTHKSHVSSSGFIVSGSSSTSPMNGPLPGGGDGSGDGAGTLERGVAQAKTEEVAMPVAGDGEEGGPERRKEGERNESRYVRNDDDQEQLQLQQQQWERDEQGYREGERKKGVLRKMQLHKV